jgi:hypothetical protein
MATKSQLEARIAELEKALGDISIFLLFQPVSDARTTAMYITRKALRYVETPDKIRAELLKRSLVVFQSSYQNHTLHTAGLCILTRAHHDPELKHMPEYAEYVAGLTGAEFDKLKAELLSAVMPEIQAERGTVAAETDKVVSRLQSKLNGYRRAYKKAKGCESVHARIVRDDLGFFYVVYTTAKGYTRLDPDHSHFIGHTAKSAETWIADMKGAINGNK